MKRSLVYILVILFPVLVQSQQVLTMGQADSLFLQNNFLLLAGKYKVDAQRALVQQAKVWNNPSLNAELNLYNPVKDKFFDVGNTGQKIFGIDQLIYIAGQRNKRVKLAREQAVYSELEFNELMRTLKMQLRSSFYSVHFSANTIVKYDEQSALLESLLSAYEEQSSKGNIPLKEVMRLKVVYFQLQHDRANVYRDFLDNYKVLQTLVGTTDSVVPLVYTEAESRYRLEDLAGLDLYNEALENRPDMQQTRSMLRQSVANNNLQKSLAFPDLHLGAVYDQAGSYVNNYSGVTLGIDLPVFNRNQGNIRYSSALVKSAGQELKNKEIEVRNEVKSIYQNLLSLENIYTKSGSAFTRDFEVLNNGYITNFQKRNISLIEFIDFFEAYNANILQLNELKIKRIQAYEELNYAVGKELFIK